jgi:hypothetical protein
MSGIKGDSLALTGDLMSVVRDMFESRIAFNRMLGLKILSVGSEEA